MISAADLPALTVLNFVFGEWLRQLTPVLYVRVAIVAVPIVNCGARPHLHRARARILHRA